MGAWGSVAAAAAAAAAASFPFLLIDTRLGDLLGRRLPLDVEAAAFLGSPAPSFITRQ
jgi:hypothetical protein